jgi:hypothetical protein
MKRFALLAPLAILLYAAGTTTLAVFSPARGASPAVLAVTATPRLSATGTPGGDWDVAGMIEQMNGEFWDVQGFVFRVTAATKVQGDVPSVGTYATASGVVLADGTWQATVVTVGRGQVAPISSAGPSATDAPTLTNTPTPPPTNTPIPTRRSVVPPSVVVTPPARPIPVAVARPGSASAGGNPGESGGGRHPSPPHPLQRHVAPPHPAHGHRPKW